MGFIEDLRRQRQTEVKTAQRIAREQRSRTEEIEREESKRRQLSIRAVEDMRLEVIKDLEQARMHLFGQSDFPRLIQGMRDILPQASLKWINPNDFYKSAFGSGAANWEDYEIKNGKGVYDAAEWWGDALSPDNPFLILDARMANMCLDKNLPLKLGVRITWKGDGSDRFNTIPIICNPEGAITLGIRRLRLGFLQKTITLPFNTWFNNVLAQEKALESAYNNPRFYELQHYSGESGRGSDRPGQ